MKAPKQDSKWITPLKRSTERKIYFYMAMVASVAWLLTRVIET